jgi:hypothetical protein
MGRKVRPIAPACQSSKTRKGEALAMNCIAQDHNVYANASPPQTVVAHIDRPTLTVWRSIAHSKSRAIVHQDVSTKHGFPFAASFESPTYEQPFLAPLL